MYRREKKIPTIIALFFLMIGIGSAVFLERSSQSLQTSAKVNPTPEEVHLTNITDSSFTISWFTSQPTIGSVQVKDTTIKLILLDDLDNDNIPRPRNNHYVTAKNLKENTSYTITIIGPGQTGCNNEKICPTFLQKTAIRLNNSLILPPARGTIITKDNKPADTAIVYLLIGKNLPLSGRVDSSGLWVIPLNNLKSGDFLGKPEISDNDLVYITVKLSPSEVGTAVIDVKSIRQNLTIPNIQLGNSYNFIDLSAKRGLLAQTQDQKILGTNIQTNPISSTEKNSEKVDFLFPKSDNETTTDNRPRLRGRGVPGGQLIITVNSSPQTDRITVSSDGSWDWRPSQSLSPGIHHVNIQGYDEKGNPINITRKFIVLKSGERVLGDATPSSTLSPTSIPTVTPIPSPALLPATPTLLPTAVISPTNVPTAIPTTIPPRSGSIQPAFILFGGSIALLLLGIKFLISS